MTTRATLYDLGFTWIHHAELWGPIDLMAGEYGFRIAGSPYVWKRFGGNWKNWKQLSFDKNPA